MAILALERRNQVEYTKLMTLVHGMMAVGSAISAAVRGEGSNGSDELSKATSALKELMFPHLSEVTKEKAAKAREQIMKEVSKGKIQIKVVGEDKKKKGRIKLRKKT